MSNIKPAFLSDHPLYEFIAKNGWFLHYKNGEPALFPFWGGQASYLDFTNDKAYEFWTECVKKNLVDLKIFDCYTGENVAEDEKSLALTLTLQSKEKTLESNDIDKIINSVLNRLDALLHARLR